MTKCRRCGCNIKEKYFCKECKNILKRDGLYKWALKSAKLDDPEQRDD